MSACALALLYMVTVYLRKKRWIHPRRDAATMPSESISRRRAWALVGFAVVIELCAAVAL